MIPSGCRSLRPWPQRGSSPVAAWPPCRHDPAGPDGKVLLHRVVRRPGSGALARPRTLDLHVPALVIEERGAELSLRQYPDEVLDTEHLLEDVSREQAGIDRVL